MNTSEMQFALSVADFLLKATVESDIRSAHESQVTSRPELPAHLDSLYPELIARAEAERDEAELIHIVAPIRAGARSQGRRLSLVKPELPRQENL